MPNCNQKAKAIFLFYGDIVKSHGTAVYLSSFLKYMNYIWKDTDALFFQAHLSNGDSYLNDSGLPKLLKAPLGKLYNKVPIIIWRFYELLFCYWEICKSLFLRGDKSFKTLFVCGEALLPVILLCRIMGNKCIYVKMGIIEESLYRLNGRTSLKYKIIRLLEKHFLPRFEMVTVVSEGMRSYLQDKYDIPPGRVTILPCAVDQDVFGYRPDSRTEIRMDLGLQNRSPLSIELPRQ